MIPIENIIRKLSWTTEAHIPEHLFLVAIRFRTLACGVAHTSTSSAMIIAYSLICNPYLFGRSFKSYYVCILALRGVGLYYRKALMLLRIACATMHVKWSRARVPNLGSPCHTSVHATPNRSWPVSNFVLQIHQKALLSRDFLVLRRLTSCDNIYLLRLLISTWCLD